MHESRKIFPVCACYAQLTSINEGDDFLLFGRQGLLQHTPTPPGSAVMRSNKCEARVTYAVSKPVCKNVVCPIAT